jgi:hypothetical protein
LSSSCIRSHHHLLLLACAWCVLQAAALLQRHPRVEELDLSGLTGLREDFNSSACGILGFVEHVAPHLQK